MTFSSATRFVRKLHGGSQPNLVQADDGFLYVLKTADSPQGQDVPFRESVGSAIYHAFGLLTPSWRPIFQTSDFLDKNRAIWIETETNLFCPADGFAFGSLYLGGRTSNVLEILPGTDFCKVQNRLCFWLAWAVDICARHSDNRQAIFLPKPSGMLKAVFIDHSQLFGNSQSEEIPRPLASRYLDARIYPQLTLQDLVELKRRIYGFNPDMIWTVAESLPVEWKTHSALNTLKDALDRLSDSSHLTRVLEMLSDQVRSSGTISDPRLRNVANWNPLLI